MSPYKALRDGRLIVSEAGLLELKPYADVAQLVEHHLAKVRVAGSNPVVRSIFKVPQYWNHELGPAPANMKTGPTQATETIAAISEMRPSIQPSRCMSLIVDTTEISPINPPPMKISAIEIPSVFGDLSPRSQSPRWRIASSWEIRSHR